MKWVKGGPPGDSISDEALFAAYSMPNVEGRCFVRANFAMSLDGAVETGGQSKGVSSDVDRAVFHVMRAQCDLVLAGAQTVRAEGYGPMRADPQTRAQREKAGYAPVAPIAVVTRSGDLDPTARLFTEAEVPTIIVAPESSKDNLAPFASVAEIIYCGDDSVEVEPMLEALAERGLTRVLCEGGPHLVHDIAAGGSLDQLCLTLSPLVAGLSHQKLATAAFVAPVQLELAHVIQAEGSLFLKLDR